MADKISENLRAKRRSKQHSKGRPVEPETDKKGNEQRKSERSKGYVVQYLYFSV